jgi:AbrB family looped-hinge helix DNA binding protein
MDALSVTSKGQVTIPKHVRQKLGIRTGSRVTFTLVGDRAELTVVDAAIEVQNSGAGLLRHKRSAVPADFNVASLLAPVMSDGPQ